MDDSKELLKMILHLRTRIDRLYRVINRAPDLKTILQEVLVDEW